ncbi:eCIS core domain-containing protein [Nitrosospira briensis]|uniref:eCIS core domain-containing protein n=1 Tax=Nitrosospira briensis TaxID=35799 RepID=UPI0008E773EF|nr:DUF4157 domain-containing protein [Nitrosospira briensis]SFN69916.1 protein of unknown function [Nitrosospira briensis]
MNKISQTTDQHKASLEVVISTLQRKCACGTQTIEGKECADCNNKGYSLQRETANWKNTVAARPLSRMGMIQRKLTIGESNDSLEQEADRTACQVTSMSVDLPHGTSPKLTQRFAKQPDGRGSTTPTSVNHALESPYRTLEPRLQHRMESHFGHDFSAVRLHVGREAEQSALEVNADAYTVGNDIVFGKDKFMPSTREGQWLIAHELTHVIQQTEASDALTEHGNKSNLVRSSAKWGKNITPFLQRRRRMGEVAVPKLSLYQADSDAAAHFQAQASQISGAIRLDASSLACPEWVSYGPSPYSSGAEIVHLIDKTYRCTGHQVREIHIFSHGNPSVVAAAEGAPRVGLYSSPSRPDRGGGGRSISDIPLDALAPNAVFVLHGCRIGSGDDSFAELLLRHILGTSPRARVYAHSTSGMCGRDLNWREFSSRRLEGRAVPRNPFYSSREE